MRDSAFDLTIVVVCLVVAALIAAVLIAALGKRNYRRGWLAAAALFAGLTGAGILDLVRVSPRETLFGIVIVGVALPVLGTLVLLRGTYALRPWLRATIAVAVAFVLIFAGFLLGALVARWLPF